MPIDHIIKLGLVESSRMQRDAITAIPQPWWDEQMQFVTAMAELQEIADNLGWEDEQRNR